MKWLRWWLMFRGSRRDTPGGAEAERRRCEAERKLREARRSQPEVRELSRRLGKHVQGNHFAEMVEEAFRAGDGRDRRRQ